jgi:hypothetical protein
VDGPQKDGKIKLEESQQTLGAFCLKKEKKMFFTKS